MLSGINTDIEHGGKIYHVQTEDGGQHNPVIVTHLFAGGAILSSRKVSYADIIQAGPNPDVIREMMKEQHQAMIKGLTSEQLADGSRSGAVPKAEVRPPTPPPPPLIPRGRRTLDEVIDEYLQSKRSQSV
jgi:hypothetical protein